MRQSGIRIKSWSQTDIMKKEIAQLKPDDGFYLSTISRAFRSSFNYR